MPVSLVEGVLTRYRQADNTNYSDLSRNHLRQLVREIIRVLLHDFAGRKIRMSYTSFDWDVRTCHKIDMAGWPADIPFKNPGTLPPVDLYRLLARLRKGLIYFFRVSLDGFVPAEQKVIAPRSDIGDTRNALTPRFVPEEYLVGEDN
ncbi:hypothetical protein EIP91_010780 [Steccherinum ochraceum]|uniref:Uncharacterized protein n=1 Tax=Steccherinum ochraceum TaxID=92696 RepID=A0A4R0RC78_9APHY|nr:hypothetical protein EIP91_010780 [Steccherinum ochraceum]